MKKVIYLFHYFEHVMLQRTPLLVLTPNNFRASSYPNFHVLVEGGGGESSTDQMKMKELWGWMMRSTCEEEI